MKILVDVNAAGWTRALGWTRELLGICMYLLA
jgi:hypothetical protein